MLTDSYKLGEAHGSKKYSSFGISEWSRVGIPEGASLGNNAGNNI